MDGRTPKNLQDLLRFAVCQQNEKPNDSIKIDEDKQKFLEKVIQSMSVNVIEEFLKAVQILQNSTSCDEDKVNALDLIADYIDNIDFANSFIKVEGADILIKCMSDTNKSVQVSTINIVAEMCQNNPFCQKYFCEKDVLHLLINFLDNDDYDIVASALYALSAMVRNFEPALAELQKRGGLKCIVNCLNKNCDRVFVKACFLLTSISSEFSLIRDEFVKMDAFNILRKNLNVIDDYEVRTEMMLLAMSVLAKSSYCKPNKEEKVHITDILTNIIKKNQNLPQCQEIVSYANSILSELTDE